MDQAAGPAPCEKRKRKQVDTPALIQKKKKQVLEGSRQTTIEKTQDKLTGIRTGAHGVIYQVKLLMLFVLRGLRQGLTFSLGTEVIEAEKFDDIVFSCYKTDLADPDKEYRFLQAKHRQDGSLTISSINLLNESGGDFSILKYFTSYFKIKRNEKFTGKLKDFTICSNIDLHSKVLPSVFEIDKSKDDILSHKTCHASDSKLYKFKKNSEIHVKLIAIIKQKHSKHITDDEIEEFFDKLVLAVKQPNEAELGNIIESEISEKRNLIDGKLVASKFLEHMLDWVNEKIARFLHPEDIEQIFQSLKQNFARSGLIGLSLFNKFKFKKCFSFKDDTEVVKDVKAFLSQERKQILTVYYKIKLLSAMKILQASGLTKLDEDIFSDLEFLQELVDTEVCPIEAFRSEAYNYLVIVVDDDTILSNAESIFQRLFEVLKVVNKRIILLISHKQKKTAHQILEKLLEELAMSDENYVAIEDNDNNFASLTDESIQKILDESKILFQGRYVSLGSIIGKNKELISSNTLFKLISNESIDVGTIQTTKPSKDAKDHFVDRKLRRRINICDDIYKRTHFFLTSSSEIDENNLKTGQEIVLISEYEDEYKKLLVNSRHRNRNVHWLKKGKHYAITKNWYFGNQEKHEYMFVSLEELVNYHPISRYVIDCEVIAIISNEKSDFIDLCERCSNKNIHWYDDKGFRGEKEFNNRLGPEEPKLNSFANNDYAYIYNACQSPTLFIHRTDALVWQQTEGDISRLRELIDDVNTMDKYKPMEAVHSNEKVVIISAEPGMGKSTLLTHVATTLEADHKDTRWIVFIVLKDYFVYFAECTSVSKSKAIQLLYKIMFEQLRRDDEETENDFLTVGSDGEVSLQTNKYTSFELDSFEVKLFTHFYNQGKVVIYFDGFDEISPVCKDVVLGFIEKIKQTRVQKMWVTTRPYNITNELEDTLQTFAYQIVPLIEEEQIYMLTKLWEKTINTELNKEQCTKFANELSKLFSQHIPNPCEFNSIPLNIQMIAARYVREFKEFCISDNKNILTEIGNNFTLHGLYEKFINSKLDDIYGGPFHDHTVYVTMKQRRKHALEEHKYFALIELFAEDELKQLLPEEKLNSVRKLIDCNIKEPNEKSGLIDRVIKGKPHFVHRTFAEHLAANLLVDMLDRKSGEMQAESARRFLYDMLTKEDSNAYGVFTFLNYKLAADSDDSVALNAILNNYYDETDKSNSIRDRWDRSLLHLAAYNFGLQNTDSQHGSILLRKDEEDILVKDKLFGWTPLHYDVIRVNIFYKPISYSDDFLPGAWDIQDVYGRTPFMLAVQNGHKKMIKETDNINLDVADDQGRTVLHYACMHNRRSYIEYIIARDPDLFKKDLEGIIPLHYLFKIDSNGSIELLKSYLKHAKNAILKTKIINCLNSIVSKEYNCYIVHLIAHNLLIAEFLLKHSLIVVNIHNNYGETACHFVARDIMVYVSSRKILLTLLRYKPDLNTKDYNGDTPLNIAFRSFSRNAECLKPLLLGGAYFDTLSTEDLRSNEYLETFEKLFNSVKRNGLKEVISILERHIDAFIHVNAQSKDSGKTPLDYAIPHGNKQLVDCLLSHGAFRYSMSHENDEADVILFDIIKEGKIDDVDRCINEGADVNVIDYRSGMPPLHLAIAHGHVDIADRLIARGARVDCRAAGGDTILHTAASKSSEVLVHLLTTLPQTARDQLLQSVDACYMTVLKRAVVTDDLLTVKALPRSCMDEYNPYYKNKEDFKELCYFSPEMLAVINTALDLMENTENL